MALLGESELTEGVDGQEQATAGSRKIANAPKRSDLFVAVIVAMGALSSKLADGQSAAPFTSIGSLKRIAIRSLAMLAGLL